MTTSSYPPPHPAQAHHVPGLGTTAAYHAAAAHPTASTLAQQAAASQHVVAARQAAYAEQSALSRNVAMQRAISAQHNAAGSHTSPAAHRAGATPQSRPGSPAPAPPAPEQSPFLTYPLPPRQSTYPTSPPWLRPPVTRQPAAATPATPEAPCTDRLPWHVTALNSLRRALGARPLS